MLQAVGGLVIATDGPVGQQDLSMQLSSCWTTVWVWTLSDI